MLKIGAVAIGAAALFVLLLHLSPPYLPLKAVLEFSSAPDARCIDGLETADLDEDGEDEVIKVHNCRDLAERLARRRETKEAAEPDETNTAIIDNYGNGRLYGGLQESDFHFKFGISGAVDADGDGVKELYLQRADDDVLQIFRISGSFSSEALRFTLQRTVDCGDDLWTPGLSVVGAFQDSATGRSMLLGKVATGECAYPRGLYSFAADGSPGLARVYLMGAFPSTIDAIDWNRDGAIEIFVATDTPGNGGSINGTNDTTAYVIALDRELREIWKVDLGRRGNAHAYICGDRASETQRLLVMVRYDNAADSALALILDPATGREIGRNRLATLPESQISHFDERSGRRTVIAGSLSAGRIIQYDVSGNSLVAVRNVAVSRGRILPLRMGDVIGDSSPEIAAVCASDRSLWVLNGDLEPLIRISPLSKTEFRNIRALRCGDGVPRLIYTDGQTLVVSRIEHASRTLHVARNYWGLLAYGLFVGGAHQYARKFRPDPREGRLKLLEHLRVSASHGQLSIVKHLGTLSETIKMVAVEQGRNAAAVNHLEGLLRIRHRKWNNDFQSIISIARFHRLYPDIVKGLAPCARAIDGLLDGVSVHLSSGNPIDVKLLLETTERLKESARDVEAGLLAVLSDLEESISTDFMRVLMASLAAFSPELEKRGIAADATLDADERERTSDHRVKVAAEPPASGEPLMVRIPEDVLFTVIDNLLSNAIHALEGSAQKKIAINVESRKYAVQLSIRDTGCGIAQELQGEVFDMGVSTKGSSGTGLWYNRHILERFGGKIELASEGAGKGATFIVTVPRARRRGGS